MSHGTTEEAINSMGTSTSSQEGDSVNDILDDEEFKQSEVKSKKQKWDPNRPKSDLRFLSFNVRVDSVMDGEDRWANRKKNSCQNHT